jgi:signal transduction histidine kinase/ligand-binding sensor domain-containing protein/CheY-like chemotaxis protein/AraC-like DNA-binding protein
MRLRYFACCVLLLINIAHAQNADPVRYIGIEHGLSNNSVICIYQDHNGFMWFGTYDGLNRYDGYEFKVYRNRVGDSTSLLDNTVYSIQGDKNHILWIAGRKGLSLFNPVRNSFSTVTYADLKNHSQKIGGTVHAVKIDDNSNVLVGTESNGLILFSNGTNKGRQLPLVQSSGFITGHYEVSSIELNQDKQYAWAFIENEGLALYDRKKNAVRLINTYFKKINCLKADDKGHLWVGTDNGCHRYDIATNSFSGNYLTAQSRIVNISIDKSGKLWLSSDGGDGIFTLLPGENNVKPFKVDGQNVLSSNAVFSVYEDQEGRKWIGTLRGGIDVIESYQNPFKKIFDNSDKPVIPAKNFINSFCETKERNIWIGTSGGGLKYWDRHSNTYINYLHDPQNQHSISSNAITYIINDASNQTWMATWNGGINRFNGNKNSFEHYTCFNPYTSAIENNVWFLYEDSKKTLWASTTNNGTLYTYNKEKNRFEIFDPKLVNIQCLSEDRENNLWGGNYSSLIKIDRANKKHTTYEIGYAVRSIHEDGAGNLWVGTDGGGLLKLNKQDGSFVRFTMDNGLTNNSVLRILEDKKGNLWLSTFNGLSQFDTKKNQFRNFSQSDGLQSNQFNFNAAASLSTGEFVFGGIKGFNIFYPDSIYERKETPQLFLTAIRVNNKGIEENDSYVKERELETIKKITVPFDQAILSIEFVALDYSSTDKINYAYQLQGWDKNWNYVNKIRTANYSRLQEGTYTFKIKVTNSDGIWSEETQLLKITIMPPWYRTWWAYAIYVLILFGAIYLYVVYSKRQERLKYEVKLAHLENEKEKELTEKRISFFTHISHEFRTPLTLIINPLKDLVSSKNNEKERKDVFMIYRNARRLLSLVDQLLLFRKVESIDQHLRIERFDIAEACHDVFLSFNHHAISKNIDFTFEKAGSEIFVYGDKEKIEIILFNLVSNAFKYTNAGGEITLTVRDNLYQVEISVKDTGSGIPEEVGNKLFESFYQANNSDKASQTGFGIGLYVSNKLAAAHHGKLTYCSREGKGAEFQLSLLKGKEHFPSQFISEDFKSESSSTILQELVEDPGMETTLVEQQPVLENKSKVIDKLTSDLPSMLIVDDNAEIRSYIRQIFTGTFNIYEAEDGTDGYETVLKESPDIVISDIKMKKMDGIELCQKIKNNPAVAHIPVILLTASSSDEIKLKGIEGGAEDYITKPFDKEIIIARVQNILKGRNRLQQYFFNAVTLKPVTSIAGEHKQFIERCIAVVEDHLDNPDFTIQTFCKAIGMSHPSLYKKVKAVSGLTINVFIRYIRLRKAAELLITTDKTITEIAYVTGFNDIRYFREQFFELFKMNPSDYVKSYRKVLRSKTVQN